MTGRQHIAALAVGLGLGVALAACSGNNPLTTGTLLGGTPKEAQGPTPESPIDRAKHLGTTSARAQRCGYVFDPQTLRSNYFASEQQQGLAADQFAKVEKTYDLAAAVELKTSAGDEGFCSDGMTSRIKRDLNQALAGDYSTPKKADAGFSILAPASSQGQLDRDKIFNPQR